MKNSSDNTQPIFSLTREEIINLYKKAVAAIQWKKLQQGKK